MKITDRYLFKTQRPRYSSLLLTICLLCQWGQPGLLEAKPRSSEIQQIDISDTEKTTVVQIHGRDLTDYQPLLMKDPKTHLPPKLYITFNNTTIAANVQGMQSGAGAVTSVEIDMVTKKPMPISQVVINLSADVSTQIKKQDGIRVIIDKKGLAAKPDAAVSSDLKIAAVPAPTDQLIQPGDNLYFSVSPADELSRDVVVDENGKISVPYAGAISATGLTADQLGKRITSALSRYVTNPKVDVLIKQSQAKQISITGEVSRPSPITYRANLRLLDALSMAGGILPTGNKRQVRVLRGNGPERRMILVNEEDVMASGDVKKDFLLEPGDLIEVTKGTYGITVFGEVERAGTFDFVADMRMLDLVALCGGFKDGANKRIKLIRGEPPNTQIIPINFQRILENKKDANIPLQPGDIVYVPTRPLWSMSTYALTLGPIATLALAAATVFLAVKKMKMDDELSLRDFFAMLRRRRREFAAVWGGIFLAVAAYTWMVTPLYRAQVIFRVQISDDSSNRPVEDSVITALQGPQQTFDVQQMLSPEIMEEAVRRMNKRGSEKSSGDLANEADRLLSRSSVQFSDENHQLVSLSVVSPRGRDAADEANELSKVMVEQVTLQATAKAHQSRQFIEDQLKETQQRLTDSEDKLRHFQEKFGPKSAETISINQLIELRNRRTQLSKKYTLSFPELQEVNAEIHNIEKQLQQVPLQEVDLARVARDVRLNEEMYTMLMKKQEESQIVESARLAPITIVDPASEPMTPEYPNTRFNLTVGMVVGLFVALTFILAREHFDTSMVTTEEIEAYLQLSVLATIPHIDRRELASHKAAPGPSARRRDPLGEARFRLICHFPPQSPFAEVYHILRNNLVKGNKVQQNQVYLFTSSVVAEGKSTTAANFAIAAAQAGIPTLLAEVDLRKPMVDKLFNLNPEPGLTNYFYLSPRWESCVADWETIKKGSPSLTNAVNSNGMGNLHILPSGKLPTNPVSLLSSDRFTQLVKDMRRRYPLVVLDGAPTMLFADSAILGPHVDGVVLVYRFGRTAREVLSRAHNQLSSSNAKILGVVVNDIQKGDGANYDTYYSEYAYKEPEPQTPPLKKTA